MEEEYHDGEELTMAEVGMSMEELARHPPVESFRPGERWGTGAGHD